MRLFLPLALSALLATSAIAQTLTPGVPAGSTPGGSSGNVQTNNGSGGFAGIATTGSGSAVLATSPTLVTPALGTPSAVVLTNGTALPVPGGLTATGTPSSSTYLRGDGAWATPSGSGCSAACTYTDTQTITLGTALHSSIVTSGFSSTGSDITPMMNWSGTINTSGAIDAFKIAYTATSCANANANLLNIYGGTGGATSAIRVQCSNLKTWFGGDIDTFNIAANNISGTQITAAAASVLGWAGRMAMKSAAAGHINYQNASNPTVGTCGTSPTVNSASQDAFGAFTTGTGTPITCVLTFAVAYGTAPICLVENQTLQANLTSYAVSTTAITLTQVAAASQTYVYSCMGV